jgi:hypothetical protein
MCDPTVSKSPAALTTGLLQHANAPQNSLCLCITSAPASTATLAPSTPTSVPASAVAWLRLPRDYLNVDGVQTIENSEREYSDSAQLPTKKSAHLQH